MTAAALYCRVSSDPRGAGRSVTEQETSAREHCGRQGWTVARVFVDNDVSASRYSRKARPEFDRLVTFLATGKADVLVTWEASRATRDLAVYVELRELCRDRGVRWSYSGRTYDLTRTDDRLSTGLDALLSERESDLTRERVMRAVRANAEAGRPHGRQTYGYRRIYDPETGDLTDVVEHEEQAARVRMLVGRFLAGESLYALAREMNTQGMAGPGGGTWHPASLQRLLANPAYAGKRVHRGVVVGEAIWPPILDDLTSVRLQRKLSDPSRKANRDGARKHLLAGVAICGRCHRPVKVAKNRGRHAYTCPNFHMSRVEREVDLYVVTAVLAYLNRPDVRTLLARRSDADQDVRTALAEVETLRDRLEDLSAAAAAGTISMAMLGKAEQRLTVEIGEAEKKARRSSRSPVLDDAVGISDEEWATKPVPVRREIIRSVATVTVMPAGRGKRIFDERLIVLGWI